MSRYLVKRFFLLIFVAILISMIMFAIYQLIPFAEDIQVEALVDKSLQLKNPDLYKLQLENARKLVGVGQPVYIKYLKWVRNFVTGNWGNTLVNPLPIAYKIKTPLWNTVKLNLLQMVLVFAISFPLGIKAAVKKYSVYDKSILVTTSIGMSLPTFFIALLLILLFASTLHWLPTSGVSSSVIIRDQMNGFEKILDDLKYMILPTLTLTLGSFAGIVRVVRGSMIDVLSQDYIKTARAKGLREKVVIYSHAFRNSMIPVVGILAGWILSVFSGATITEQIFGYNGMGKTLYDALLQSDFNFVMIINVFLTLLGLVGNIVVDVLYTVVDPRIRLG